jgi:hypothetical protein
LGCAVHIVPPGKKAFPFHRHHVQDELFFVISGEGEYRFGEKIVRVRSGDIVAAPAGSYFSASASSVSQHHLARVGDDVPVPRSRLFQQPPPLPHTTTEPGARAGVCASAVWRHAGAAIKCRPQAAAGRHCSKLGRQIAVDLKADAHFDKCRSCP